MSKVKYQRSLVIPRNVHLFTKWTWISFYGFTDALDNQIVILFIRFMSATANISDKEIVLYIVIYIHPVLALLNRIRNILSFTSILKKNCFNIAPNLWFNILQTHQKWLVHKLAQCLILLSVTAENKYTLIFCTCSCKQSIKQLLFLNFQMMEHRRPRTRLYHYCRTKKVYFWHSTVIVAIKMNLDQNHKHGHIIHRPSLGGRSLHNCTEILCYDRPIQQRAHQHLLSIVHCLLMLLMKI
jgi:hypothetical protein